MKVPGKWYYMIGDTEEVERGRRRRGRGTECVGVQLIKEFKSKSKRMRRGAVQRRVFVLLKSYPLSLNLLPWREEFEAS